LAILTFILGFTNSYYIMRPEPRVFW